MAFFSKTKVRMVASVDEYVAGKCYRLEKSLADRFIARGYASGTLSRAYSEDELADMRANQQTILV